jgi:ribose 5-phosphate isomerase B
MSEPEALTVVVGCDQAGLLLRDVLRRTLQESPHVAAVIDVGVTDGDPTPYPSIGIAAAEMIADGRADRALLICGTGLGMAISANKVIGVRAVTAHDCYSVERAVLSNDAQVLALGARVIGPELAVRLVREWVGYRFDASSHSAANVKVIEDYDAAHSSGDRPTTGTCCRTCGRP